jgi:hypothetical protein
VVVSYATRGLAYFIILNSNNVVLLNQLSRSFSLNFPIFALTHSFLLLRLLLTSTHKHTHTLFFVLKPTFCFLLSPFFPSIIINHRTNTTRAKSVAAKFIFALKHNNFNFSHKFSLSPLRFFL